VISLPPQADEPDESGSLEGSGLTGRPTPPVGPEEDQGSEAPDGWDVVGSAGRGVVAPDEADQAARTYWEGEANAYQAEHGAFLADPLVCAVDSAHPVHRNDDAGAGAGFVWGPEGVTEAELGMLEPLDALAGRTVLEVGCGAAQCSAWLAQRGVHAVGIDIAVNQLRHSGPRGAPVSVVAATATALPFVDNAFDAAFASYGAVQFVADLPGLLGEVRRVLRPGGRWVFSVSHPIRWAFPDDPGPAGLSVSGSYFDRTPYVERDESGAATYAEFHRTLGDYVSALTGAGFRIESMVEPEWPDWNEQTWGGWSPLRGMHLPGTLIIGCRADDRAG
jgi:SAM-dependent methyltransferase